MRPGLCGIVLCVTAAQAWADTAYKNDRFDFAASIPDDFVRTHTASSGDGATFNDASGAEIAVYAYTLDLEIAADFVVRGNYWTEAGGKITYQASGDTWYVQSGVTAEGAIFYSRHVSGKNCDGVLSMAVMTWTYDPAEKPRIDPLVGPAVASLRFSPCK